MSIVKKIMICGYLLTLQLLVFAGPLHDAAQKGDIERVRELLDRGKDWRGRLIDIDGLDRSGWGNRIMKSPLHYAVESEQVTVVDELLGRGANVNVQAVVTVSGDELPCGTPLHTAAAHGLQAIARALIEHNANVNVVSAYGATPLLGMFPRLQDVSEEDHLAMIRLLKEAGANLNLGDEDGMTPLHKAEEYHYQDAAKLLRSLGASDKCRTTQPYFHRYYVPEGSTPRDLAEINQTMEDHKVRAYAEALRDRLTDTILAAKTIRSGLVANVSFHPAEAIARGIRGLGSHVPGGAVLAAILERVAAQDKDRAIRKVAALVQDPAQINALSSTVASYVARFKVHAGVFFDEEAGRRDGESDAQQILQEVARARKPFTEGDVVQNLVRCIDPTFIRPIGWSEWIYRQYMIATSCCRRPKVD